MWARVPTWPQGAPEDCEAIVSYSPRKNGHRLDACGAPRRDDCRAQCGDGKEHRADGKAG